MFVPDQPWRGLLEGLHIIISETASPWCNTEELLRAYQGVKDHFSEDLEFLGDNFMFAYDADENVQVSTDLNALFLRRLYAMDRPPSVAAMAVHGVEHLTENCPKDLKSAVLIAGILAGAEHDLPYHSNMHFRKVLIQTIRTIKAHNSIYEGTARALGDTECALLIIAACIHDIGHDGKGNTIEGVFEQWRLERQSFEYAEPYLRAAGLSDDAHLDAIKTMLLCTDVNPLADPRNPSNQMKAAYQYHFLGEKYRVHTLNLAPELEPLQNDSVLTMMSMILHEADIATSAGLTYAVSKFETIMYYREFSENRARPSSLLDFINRVCQRKMLGDAAQKLYGANMARIIALAEADVERGNDNLPAVEHCEFWLMQDGVSPQDSKTIN